MGQLRFSASPSERITQEVLELAYLSGIDRTPWPVRSTAEGNDLVLERDVSESGCLTVPWEVEGHGLLALSTATLLERPEPFQLPLELARGAINQLRNQLAEWVTVGLAVPNAVTEKLGEAIQRFSRCVVSQEEPQSPASAQEALGIALDASRILAAAYAEQVLSARRRVTGRLPSLLGGELSGPALDEPSARLFLGAFNAALVPIAWRDIEATEGSLSWAACDQHIEWCRAQGLKVCAGPLLELDARGLPDWVYLWEDDFDNLLAAASQFIKAVVRRYRGKVDLWVCAGRVNTSEALSFSEEEHLQLAAAALHLVRTIDPAMPRVVSIDEPWGEYMSRRTVDSPPLHFADALVRAGLDLRGLMLEMNVRCARGATLPRTELEFSRHLDLWSMLGLPLLVSLNVPSEAGDDPLGQRQVGMPSESWSPEGQQAWVARYVPVILAKPSVQGLFWNQLRDSQPHDFSHAGLFDADRQPKPALRTLVALRTVCLGPPEARRS